MAGEARVITLTSQQRAELERMRDAPTAPAGLHRRARAVLLMADNVAGVEVGRMTGYTPVQVSRIRRRFAEGGIAGLEERPRSGRPRSISMDKTAEVVALTLKAPPRGLTHWTARELARKVRLSHATVHRIWQAHSLKPHQVSTFKFTKDPAAKEKIVDVVGLYLNPPENAVVLSVDEKTQIQALSRTQPLLPLRPGLPARQTHDYRRNGVVSLYAALEILTGKVVGQCRDSHTGQDFLGFLELIDRRFPEGDLHLVMDNSSTHTTPEVRSWLERHPRIQFHFTPKGASWINMVEGWFGILTRKSIRRGSFDTIKALVRHIGDYIRHWNSNPTPFVWTKEPEEIIAKAIRNPSTVNITSVTRH